MLFSELAKLLRTSLRKKINSRLYSNDVIEDLVQEVLLTIHQKRNFYSPERLFLPWIYTIAKNKFIDFSRQQKRWPDFTPYTLELHDFQSYVEEVLADEQWVEFESLKIKGLTDKSLKILKMAKADEVPLKEIAVRFKMSLPSVKVTIHRALKKIRKELKSK